MKKTLLIINQMQEEGLFEKYAIGGGIAVLFYIEPLVTFDLDVFIILREDETTLVSLSPIYSWLKKKKYELKKEHILIEGLPVQFIPAYNDLVREAVLDSVQKTYEDVETFIFRSEYLIAIMLQTGRPKDKERILKMMMEADISNELLVSFLKRHDLHKKYVKMRERYFES